MTLLSGLTRSNLKWDPYSWRHFRDSADDERFFDQLKLLRAPQKNLNPAKYIDCIAQGIRRQHLTGYSQVSNALFWEIINAKPLPAFQPDDVPGVMKALRTMPSSSSPIGAMAWATAIRAKLEQAQRGRELATLPDEVELWFSALQPWTTLEKAAFEDPALGKAPKWVQCYGAFLNNFKAGGSATQLATNAFFVQLGQEKLDVALNIFQHFVRLPLSDTHSECHSAAIQMLEMLATNEITNCEVSLKLITLGSKLFEPARPGAERIVAAILPRIPEKLSRDQNPFLIKLLKSCWNNEDMHRLWRCLPKEIRKEQLQLVLDRLGGIGVYTCVLNFDKQDLALPSVVHPLWTIVESELRTLQPWSKTTIREMMACMPNTELGLRLAIALDPSMDIIHALAGDAWKATWQQRVDAQVINNEPMTTNIFEFQEF